MNKGYYLKLTQALYRVTDIFPEGEFLKFQIRQKANEILTGLILLGRTDKKEILNNIEVLESYFEIARFQNWVNPFNFLVLEQEYTKIKKELEGETGLKESAEKPIIEQPKTTENTIFLQAVPELERSQDQHTETAGETRQGETRQNGRHQKILDLLKEKGKAQVWELKQIFPDISKRTLRRDFDYLLNQGLVERIGENNNTFYQVKIIR